jgi:uncharacterized protein YecT (DUF1311 family)
MDDCRALRSQTKWKSWLKIRHEGGVLTCWSVGFLSMALVACLVAVHASGEGGNSSSSPKLKACIDASGGVTAEMRRCLSGEHRRLDGELNRTYKSVMRQLKSTDQKRQLIESQRVWLRLRDERCLSKVKDSGMEGGTGGDLIYDDCQLNLLRQRIEWLKKVPSNPGYLKKVERS